MSITVPTESFKRENFSHLGFILASIGSAVGLGNIWRFPYMAGSHGGGAFLIPYFIGVVLFGIPLMLLELDAGRKFKGSIITTLKQINPRVKWVGVIAMVISLGTLSYYMVITGWSLAYFLYSFAGYPSFTAFTGSLQPLIFFMVSVLVIGFIASAGVKKGIETTCKYLMPFFILLLAGLALYAVMLPGWSEGILFYLSPDFSRLLNIDVWLMGLSQAFFSISVGSGILLTYGSHLGETDPITKPAVIISGADTLIAVLAGFLIFPVVFSMGLNPAAGAELSFVSLPMAFGSMAFGNIIGLLFFLLLFIAAITSAVSMFEVSASVMEDELGWTRKRAVKLLSMVIVIAGLPSALSYVGPGITAMGLPFIDLMDALMGQALLLSSAILSISIIWFYNPEVLSVPVGWLVRLKIPQAVRLLLKYVIPFVLIAMLLYGFIS